MVSDIGEQWKDEYSNESDIEASDSDSDNSFTDNLNAIGLRGLSLPTFWGVTNPCPTTDNNGNHNEGNSEGDKIKKLTSPSISRREQLSHFIEDLKSGFSLQSALDRFQTIRTLLESSIDETIQNNVDTDSEAENGEAIEEVEYEPRVIKPATEPKEVPTLLDQVIIPQSKEPIRGKKKKRSKMKRKFQIDNDVTNSEVDELALISKEDLKNESLLRKRIIKIRKLSIKEEEKNRLVQKLMMGTYYNNVKFVDDNGDEVFRISTENHNESDELFEEDETDEEGDEKDEANTNEEEVLFINDDDKVATYHDEEERILGCPHYQKNCKMECSKCKRWYACPICHDEEISTHKMKREKTKNILCMNCSGTQKPSEFCQFCDIRFAIYYCSKCQLYDNDDSKDIYHCDDCGICRLGLGLGQDFFHCDGCNACLSIELQDDHKCIERATQSDCPICGEFMFTSTKPVVFMSCGHAIHQNCYEDHSKHSYKCPTCHKTILNMEAQFRVLDMEISLHPLPEPYSQWTCIIQCNDCNAKSSCPYHVLGLKCDNCKSYNTFQKKLIKPEESDYESDMSTTNNNKQRKNITDLRNITMLNSSRLNTNYLINEEANHSSSSNLHLHELRSTNSPEKDLSPLNSDNEESKRTLTLPQQFLSNIDEYLANIDYESSEDEGEDDDEVDFLRVNRTLKHIKNEAERNSNEYQRSKIANKNLESSKLKKTSSSNFLTNAIRDFLKPGNDANDKKTNLNKT